MSVDWSPFVDLVRKNSKFLLTTHIRPDPDGLGSQLGLAEILENMGKEVRLVISSNWPPRYDFLDPPRRIRRFELPGDAYRDVDAVVILDTGTWNQLGDFGPFLKTLTVPKVVIDHHLTQDVDALRLVDTTAEATGRLVYEAVQALGQKLTPTAANALFAALATDTGWFRHRNTTPATFALAEKLTEAGAQPTELYDRIYEQNSLARMRLMGLVLQRLRVVDGGKVAYTEVRKDDYATTGALPQDTEDMVNFTRSVTGVEVGLFFLEQPAGGIKVSFRSRQRVDVARIAEMFGGGGHRLASGAVLPGPIAEAERKVLEAVRKALGVEATDGAIAVPKVRRQTTKRPAVRSTAKRGNAKRKR